MTQESSSTPEFLQIDTSPDATLPLCQDFGRILQGNASGLARPNSVQAVQQILEIAESQGIQVTVRGGGMSQSGQSLGVESIVLVTDRLHGFDIDSNQGIAHCGAAITWRELLGASLEVGWIPHVMPLNLDLTIGGVLSAGGVGSTSHHASVAIDFVEQITLVTGLGEQIIATPQDRPEVFAAMLGGAGRFGILCNATLRLRRFKPLIRTFYLLFDSLESNLLAQQKLTQRGCSHLEGFCSGAIQGARKNAQGQRVPFFEWFYGLHVGFEFEGETEPKAEDVLKDIHPYRFIHAENDTVASHATRYDFRFAAMHENGTYDQLHPWLEALVPINKALIVIPKIIATQPVWLGDGHRITVFSHPHVTTSFCTPESPCVAFAILPMGVPETLRAPTLTWLKWVDSQLLQVGAKRYVSGWLPDTTITRWKSHFGERFTQWQQAKQMLDPAWRLTSLLFREADSAVFDI